MKLRAEWRYEATIMRDRFEQNRNIDDLRIARQKYLEGVRELRENAHLLPFKCNQLIFIFEFFLKILKICFLLVAYSPGGISYDREPASPDFVKF